jgi:uncharacterized protein
VERQDRPLIFVKLHSEQQGAATPAGATRKATTIKKGEVVDVSDKILSFRFEDEERKADRLEITLDNHDLVEFDNPAWKHGGILEVSWGYPGHMSPPRRVVIRKTSGGRELKVEALGLEMLMHTAKTLKVYQNKTLFELVTEVSKKYSSVVNAYNDSDEPDCISQSAKQVKLAHVSQSAQTDAQLISKLAKKYGYVFYIDHQGVHFKPRDEVYKKAPTKILTWFNGDGEWLDFSYENDGAEKASKVVEKGIDPLNQKAFQAEGSDDATKRSGLAPRVREIPQATGEQILTDRTPQEYIDSKDKATAGQAQSGGDNKFLSAISELVDVSPAGTTNPLDAKAKADGKYKKRQGHKHELSGKLIGDPKFLAKSIIQVEGLGRRLSGKWAVKKVEHTIDSGGYLCDFKAERDGDHGYGQKGEANSKAALNKLDPKPTTDDDAKVRRNWQQPDGQLVLTTRNPQGTQ